MLREKLKKFWDQLGFKPKTFWIPEGLSIWYSGSNPRIYSVDLTSLSASLIWPNSICSENVCKLYNQINIMNHNLDFLNTAVPTLCCKLQSGDWCLVECVFCTVIPSHQWPDPSSHRILCQFWNVPKPLSTCEQDIATVKCMLLNIWSKLMQHSLPTNMGAQHGS